MVQRRRNEAEFQTAQAIFDDAGKFIEIRFIVAAKADDFIEEGPDALPDLFVFLAFFGKARLFIFFLPLAQGVGDAQPAQPSVQQGTPIAQAMGFLGFVPAGEEDIPHALADVVDALQAGFFPFVHDLWLFLPAPIGPFAIPQPMAALDTVSQTIIFQIVDIVAAHGKEVRLEQAKDRLMGPAAAEDAEQGRNRLGRRMAGHGPAIVAEAGDAVAPEDAFDPVVVQIARPGQDEKVTITIALMTESGDFPGNAVDFAVPVGTFPDFQGRYGLCHFSRYRPEEGVAKDRQRAVRSFGYLGRFQMRKEGL